MPPGRAFLVGHSRDILNAHYRVMFLNIIKKHYEYFNKYDDDSCYFYFLIIYEMIERLIYVSRILSKEMKDILKEHKLEVKLQKDTIVEKNKDSKSKDWKILLNNLSQESERFIDQIKINRKILSDIQNLKYTNMYPLRNRIAHNDNIPSIDKLKEYMKSDEFKIIYETLFKDYKKSSNFGTGKSSLRKYLQIISSTGKEILEIYSTGLFNNYNFSDNIVGKIMYRMVIISTAAFDILNNVEELGFPWIICSDVEESVITILASLRENIIHPYRDKFKYPTNYEEYMEHMLDFNSKSNSHKYMVELSDPIDIRFIDKFIDTQLPLLIHGINKCLK